VTAQGSSFKGIVIGDDVWIGANAVIMDGVRAGSHSVVAAGAVVTKNVPEFHLVAGVPAKALYDKRDVLARKDAASS
jgi:acetyltransferase-like isoleucine patch superfamily enzyme